MISLNIGCGVRIDESQLREFGVDDIISLFPVDAECVLEARSACLYRDWSLLARRFERREWQCKP
jgi:hypothetical protein